MYILKSIYAGIKLCGLFPNFIPTAVIEIIVQKFQTVIHNNKLTDGSRSVHPLSLRLRNPSMCDWLLDGKSPYYIDNGNHPWSLHTRTLEYTSTTFTIGIYKLQYYYKQLLSVQQVKLSFPGTPLFKPLPS